MQSSRYLLSDQTVHLTTRSRTNHCRRLPARFHSPIVLPCGKSVRSRDHLFQTTSLQYISQSAVSECRKQALMHLWQDRTDRLCSQIRHAVPTPSHCSAASLCGKTALSTGSQLLTIALQQQTSIVSTKRNVQKPSYRCLDRISRRKRGR